MYVCGNESWVQPTSLWNTIDVWVEVLIRVKNRVLKCLHGWVKVRVALKQSERDKNKAASLCVLPRYAQTTDS